MNESVSSQVSSLCDSCLNLISSQPPFTAGGIKDYVHEWTKITTDPFVLDAVTHCHIEFDYEPDPQINSTRPHDSFSSMEQQVIDNEIQKFLKKGIIRPTMPTSGDIISPIFVTPKKDGSHRVIFSLKKLNESVSYHHFKLDTLQTAVQLVTPGCFMTSIDLKDAYYSIPISEDHQKYLKFYWRDKLYTFTCLPMGLSSSPRIFTKVLKPLFSHLRSKFGDICLSYIDDSLYIGEFAVHCAETTLHAVDLFSRLGLKINPEKSVIVPSQTIEFLGFVIDSVRMTVTLTARKMGKIKSLCLSFLRPGKLFTIRQVASFIGKLVSAFPGVEFGPLHYRHLTADKEYHLTLNSHNFDAEMSLSQASLTEVQWWSDNILLSYKHIRHPAPNVVIHTDASSVGWGARIDEATQTAGIWSQFESAMHINILELLAVKFALSSLLSDQSNIHVKIMCDNTTAINYISAMGGTKSVECNAIAYDIWEWAIVRNIWLSAAHIPGVCNVAADQLSREFNFDLEWMLSRAVFQNIVKVFGQPDLDLFASRLNAQLPDYVSWKPDPEARYVDAFTIEWSNIYFYAFPPFCLLPRCVQKIIQEKASGLLIIPLWPTKPVFSTVLHLLTDVPRVVKATKCNLVHPNLVGPHPLNNKLDLLVCKLSGDSCKSQDFQMTLSTLSCPLGGNLLTNNTIRTSTSGYTFVVNNKLIPCIPL